MPAPMDIENRKDVVVSVNTDYPGLIKADPAGYTDQVAHRLNKIDNWRFGNVPGYIRDPWGRKARQPDGGNPNNDTLTYRLDVSDHSKKKLVDIIVGAGGDNPAPGWDLRPPEEESGNGYWIRPQSPDRDGSTVPTPPPLPLPPNCDPWIARVRELEAELQKARRPRVTYDEMAALVRDADAAYSSGVVGRQQGDMPPMTTMHLFWRYLLEGYERNALIEDARKRGNNEPFE